jgi:hypothetical protein
MTQAFLKQIVMFCKDSIMTSREADTALQPAISSQARSRTTDFGGPLACTAITISPVLH